MAKTMMESYNPLQGCRERGGDMSEDSRTNWKKRCLVECRDRQFYTDARKEEKK